MLRTIAVTLLALGLGSRGLFAQDPAPIRRSMEGPRLGLTYVSGGRAGDLVRKNGLRPLMTQFGWHAEQQVLPARRGPALILEEVVLVGGLEQQAFVPSATMMMGIRTPNGFEVGVGPNLSLAGSALTIGIGKSLNYGGVSLPINFAVVGSPKAMRTTILIGYAIQAQH